MIYTVSGKLDIRHLNQICTMMAMTTGINTNVLLENKFFCEVAYNNELKEPKVDYLIEHINESLNMKPFQTEGILSLTYGEHLFYNHLYKSNNYLGTIFMGPFKVINYPLHMSKELLPDIENYLNTLPSIYEHQFSSFLELLVMVSKSSEPLEGKEFFLRTNQDMTLEGYQINAKPHIKHHSLHLEEKLFTDALMGDGINFEIIRKNLTNLILPSLADDPLRSEKNRTIVSITILARMAIKLGLNSEEAFSASDYFIAEIEKLTSRHEILLFQMRVLKFYQAKIKHLNKENIYSDSTNMLLSYIESHLDSTLNLNEICDQLDLNYKYSSKLFSKEMGNTFSSIREQKRLEKSATLLTVSDLSVNAIAEKLGYNYDYYFIKQFKKKYGITPNQYRKINM